MNATARKILFPAAPVDSSVHRVWNFGLTDAATVTWFTGDKVLLERTWRGKGLADIVDAVRAEPFVMDAGSRDYAGPDIDVVDWATGRTLEEHMLRLGLHPVPVTPHD